MDGLNARKRLGATASMLALTVAVQLAATGAMAQTTTAPASRDDTSTPQTEVAPQTDGVPAGSSAGKRPVSGSMSIQNQGTVDQSNVTASDVQTPAANTTDGDDIVVTGLRQSLANAQSIKRNADTVVDAITAEDIGALPDRSVNEALQRVAGVAITRFAAATDTAHFSVEGSGVTIRGLSYVRGEFNGRDSFGVGGGREIGFNDVPTELVGSVEVYKNLTADMIEGGISGSVNINTRKPFDTKDTLIYLSGSVNYGDYNGRSEPAVVGLFSKQWNLGNGGRFGIMASGSYNRQRSRSDSVFYSAFLPRYNDDKNGNGVQDAGEGRFLNAGTPFQSPTALFDRYPVPSGRDFVYVPLGAGMRMQNFDRKRVGYSGAAQYENASRNLLVTAQFLRAESSQTWLDRTVEPNVYYADANAIFPQAGTTPTYDDDGRFTSGTLIRQGGGQYTTLGNRYFSTNGYTQDQSLNVKWDPTDRLHLNFDGQYVYSKARDSDDVVELANFNGVSIDGRGDVPQINLIPANGQSVANYFSSQTNTYIRDAMNNRTHSDGDEWAFRADAQYDVSDDSFLRKIRVGGRYATRDQTVKANDYNNWGAVSDTWTSGGLASVDKYRDSMSPVNFADFYRGEAVQPPTAWGIRDNILTDHDALTALLRTATKQGGGGYTPLEDRGTAAVPLVDGYFKPSEVYRITEKTYSGYARLDFGIDDIGGGQSSLSGNIGLRFVHTEDQSFGSIAFNSPSELAGFNSVAAYCSSPNQNNTVRAICTVSAAQQAAIVAFANGTSQSNVASQKFDKWLPSLNIKYQATDQLLFRLAASKAISRPGFTDLRNFVGLAPSSSNTTGIYGFSANARNPFLRPIDAKQVDLTAEWYFAKVGSLTAAVFYKQLSNIILDNFGYSRSLTNNGQTFPVTINGPVNVAGNADIKGAELSYQQTYDFLPGALRGLGTQATFTYISPGKLPNARPDNRIEDGNRPPLDVAGLYDGLPLAQLSKYNFNVSAFYDLAGVYARIAYSWRSKYLLTNRDCCFPFLPVYSDATGQADASLFYTVNKQFKIGVQVQNLLDATTKTSFVLNGDGLEAPRSYFKSDRQFQLSVRLTL
ncbi:TonB-dependent receptor [uncultured Sphingomonas sp.]|uniref:TonB-dependent receptor n=1 Tax=uncultured Sphingomonas sp. TaxID=158754 RepID=UPI0025D2ABDB|nr:TonB-dependent receptor [uncultured Sphingomonas sp.]